MHAFARVAEERVVLLVPDILDIKISINRGGVDLMYLKTALEKIGKVAGK